MEKNARTPKRFEREVVIRWLRLARYGLDSMMLLFLLSVLVPAEERQELRRSYELRPGAIVSLENIRGDITVTSWAEQRAEVVAVKVGPAEQLGAVEISIDADPSRLDIRTRYPRSRNSRVSVSYNLRVPRNVHLDSIKSVSGDIEISDIEGRAVARSVSGSLHVKKVGQDADLNTVSGDADVADISGRTSVSCVSGSITADDVRGDLDSKSVSGDIKISNVNGHIYADTVSGNINIRDSNPASLKASSTSGDIHFSGGLNPSGRYELKSHSGTVEAVLPRNSAFVLQASTFSGSIETDFEIRLQGRIERRSISGSIGQGGPTVELRTFSGDIRLRKREISH